jgi:preprotein translocase subunit SecF
MPLLKLSLNNKNIPFMRTSRMASLLSFCLIAGTFALLFTRGLNLGIDFAGGIVIEIKTTAPADLTALRDGLSEEKYGAVSLQSFDNANELMIRASGNTAQSNAKTSDELKTEITKIVGTDVEFRRTDYVGAVVGSEMLRDGIYALLAAFGCMLLYIWLRFEWQFGVSGLAALLHDGFITLGFYSATGYEFGLTAIAALLTIIGYSINDSVVIFDRIRDIMRKTNNHKGLAEVIDVSLNQTLSRTFLTGITTLLAAGALGMLGGEAIESFAYALCFGVLIGTYSSVYISAPLLIHLKLSLGAFALNKNQDIGFKPNNSKASNIKG